MNAPTLLVDIFVSVNLIGSIVALFFLYFLSRRYTEANIRSPLRWLVLASLPSLYSILQVWAIEREFSTQPAMRWAVLVAIAINLLIVSMQWRRLVHLHKHPHLAKLTRLLTWSLGFGVVAFGIQIAGTFLDTPPLVLMAFGGLSGILSVLVLTYGTYRARSQYPGSAIEILLIAGSIGVIMVSVTFVVRINASTRSLVLQNQTTIFQEFISRQAENHLTNETLMGKSLDDKNRLKDFVDQLNVASAQRIKILTPEGVVAESTLSSLVGSRQPVEGDLANALAEEGVIRYVIDPNELPESERSLESALVVTMPLRVSSGQGVIGAVQIFMDGAAIEASRYNLQSTAVFFAMVGMVAAEIFLLVLFLIFRRSVSHPFAELQDELQQMHVHDTAADEHRRLAVSAPGPFQDLSKEFNALINEYEEKIRELKKRRPED